MTDTAATTGVPTTTRRLVLARRPTGLVQDDDFRLEEVALPPVGPGEALVRVRYLSFDPTQRNWMNDVPSYLPPVQLGEVMRAFALGEVVRSENPAVPVGATVTGGFGWQEHCVTDGASLGRVSVVPEGTTAEQALGVFGTTGMTAYFGITEVARVGDGDVVLVSGAAGATGSVAGQIARLRGARTVIGIAGGPEKCAWVTDVAGFDACIDYRSGNLRAQLRELAPEGVDVYWDNVGGATLEAAIGALALRGRVVLCGSISSGYSLDTPAPGPRNLSLLVQRRGRMEGFIVLDYAPRFGEALAELVPWVRAGSIVTHADVARGPLEAAPATLRRLFEGANLGKQLLELTEAEER